MFFLLNEQLIDKITTNGQCLTLPKLTFQLLGQILIFYPLKAVSQQQYAVGATI